MVFSKFAAHPTLMRKFLFLFLFVGIVATPAKAQNDSLDQYLTNAMETYNQVGMAVGVIKDGEWVYKKGFGFSNADLQTQINDQTVFELASLSKAFTAASMGILVDNGLVNWDDPVKKHLPNFKMHDAWVTENMQVVDLLCHRNGYNTFDGDLLWYGTDYSAEEIAARFAKLPPKHGFRTEYGYSNLNFVNAGLLIEKVSGQSWAAFVKDSILEPLGMRDSKTQLNSFLRLVNKAHPHIEGDVVDYQDFDACIGAVGVRSNVVDLGKWARMWLHQGMLPDSTQLLQPETVNKIFSMHTPQTVSLQQIENGTLYRGAALGWFTGLFQGKRLMQHSGGLPGFILNLAIMPEENVAVVVLTNDQTVLPFAVTNAMLTQFTDITDTTDWVAKYLPYQQNRSEEKEPLKPLNPGDKSNIPLASLVGSYEDAMYGKASVRLEGKKAILTLEPTEQYFTSELSYLEPNTFRIKFKDPFLPEGKVIFELDKNNYPVGFTPVW